LRLPHYFPRVPRPCKAASKAFFDCFTAASEYGPGMVSAKQCGRARCGGAAQCTRPCTARRPSIVNPAIAAFTVRAACRPARVRCSHGGITPSFTMLAVSDCLPHRRRKHATMCKHITRLLSPAGLLPQDPGVGRQALAACREQLAAYTKCAEANLTPQQLALTAAPQVYREQAASTRQ
jgi:hypothetical protein